MSTAAYNRDFGPAVLRGLAEFGPFEPDLTLELGLSAWMRFGGVDLEGARSQMLAVRGAVLEAGEMDTATEPVPFSGRSARLDVLNLAVYLGNLMDRAACKAHCERKHIAERAAERLVTSGSSVRPG